jgi:hypothetical protein
VRGRHFDLPVGEDDVDVEEADDGATAEALGVARGLRVGHQEEQATVEFKDALPQPISDRSFVADDVGERRVAGLGGEVASGEGRGERRGRGWLR